MPRRTAYTSTQKTTDNCSKPGDLTSISMLQRPLSRYESNPVQDRVLPQDHPVNLTFFERRTEPRPPICWPRCLNRSLHIPPTLLELPRHTPHRIHRHWSQETPIALVRLAAAATPTAMSPEARSYKFQVHCQMRRIRQINATASCLQAMAPPSAFRSNSLQGLFAILVPTTHATTIHLHRTIIRSRI